MASLLVLAGMVAAVVMAWQVDWQGLRGQVLVTPRDPAPAALPYVTNDVVNLRSGPATSFAILEVLDGETPVTVTGDLRQGFLPVSVNGRDAWIAADYLTPASSRESAATDIDVAQVSGQLATRSGLLETANAAPLVIEEPAVVTEPAPPVVDAPLPTEAPVEPTEAVTQAIETPAEPTEAVTIAGDEPVAPTGEKWIEVDRSTAIVTLHHGDTIIATYQGKIGRDPSPDGYYSTAIGTFHVYMKNKELTETPFVEGVFLTDFVGFDPERSNGFHSPVRDARGNVVNTQGTVTMGCVRLEADAAEELYAFAEIGMRVEIHD
ncbi:MAG TPA: SH3 domain-containing protein [Thermomicrobiales bacterium]|nr:SH3 domain-containing protein [Thermomicrobiales bacterium]